MDYSFQQLNKLVNVKKVTLENFVEKLNLIGLEVDAFSSKKMITNVFLDELRVLIKIPANREDLLNETFFLSELSTLFLFETLEIWEKVRKKYLFLLKQKYGTYNQYRKQVIPCEKENITTYILEINQFEPRTSPGWIKNKLITGGLTSHNLLTDILNLTFLEWGQNFTSFAEKSSMPHFNVEYLHAPQSYGESEQKQILLSPGTVVVKDQKTQRIISVLGIIESSPSLSFFSQLPCRFFLEATFYDIHENPLLLTTLNTKISLKYLRRACRGNFKNSFQRILTLVQVLGFATIGSTMYCTQEEKREITSTKLLRLKKRSLRAFLNIEVPEVAIFQKAGLQIVCETQHDYYFKIPRSRQDLGREIDLIEEYSRFIGYQNFTEVLPIKEIQYTKEIFRQKQFLKHIFLQYGFSEIMTSSLSECQDQEEAQEKVSIGINNPLNKELSELRSSLLPKLLSVFEINSRSPSSRNTFFEMGRTFTREANKIKEQEKVAGVFQISMQKNLGTDWFIAKGFLENILFTFGYSEIIIKEGSGKMDAFHPTRSVQFFMNQTLLGVFGELDPFIVKENYSHVRGPIYVFELNAAYLQEFQLTKRSPLFQEYSKYPSIIKDISVHVEKNFDFKELKSWLFSESSYIIKVHLFDIYFEPIETMRVNLTVKIEFQSIKETLTNEFVEMQLEQIRQSFANRFPSESFEFFDC